MLLEIIHITAPVFMLAAIGFGWAKSGIPYDFPFVTRMGVNLAVPCLIFSVLATAKIEPSAFKEMAFAALSAHGVLWVVTWGLLRTGGLSTRTFLPPIVFANTGNIGLAICLFAYGEPGLALGMVFFAISAGLSFSFGVWAVAEGERSNEALRQPMVYACAAGGLFAWQGWTLPVWLMSGISLVGQIGIPLMLITLGVSVSLLRVGDIARAIALTFVKLSVCSIVAIVITALFGLTGMAQGVLTLQLIMPAGITTYIIAQRYGAEPQAVAGLVVVSTVMSICFIPAALAILIG